LNTRVGRLSRIIWVAVTGSPVPVVRKVVFRTKAAIFYIKFTSFKGVTVIVYKLSPYHSNEMSRGLVSSETAKQYKVFEWGALGIPEWSRRESTWRKCDCFATIESASDALISKCVDSILSSQKRLDRAKSKMDLARKWARREAMESAKLPITAQV
jgi:hypothetical protein